MAAAGYLAPLKGGGRRHGDPGLHPLSAAVRAAPARARPRRGAGLLRRGDRQRRVRGAAARRRASDGRRARPTTSSSTTGDAGAFRDLAERSWVARSRASTAVHIDAGGRRVRLTVLGSQGTWPGAVRECCGYLLTADGFHSVARRRHRHVLAAAGAPARRRSRRAVDLPRPRRPLPRHHPRVLRAPLRRAWGSRACRSTRRRASPTSPRCSCRRPGAT